VRRAILTFALVFSTAALSASAQSTDSSSAPPPQPSQASPPPAPCTPTCPQTSAKPATSPPDWKPALYQAPATLPVTAVYIVDSIAPCVRINQTGQPWFCLSAPYAPAIGWPQSLKLLPGNCTHNP
jgi:hypothetical protein